MNPTGKFNSILLYITLLVILMSYAFVNENNQSKQRIIIKLEHYVGNELLVLDSKHYKNDQSQEYSISKFRYYISNITLKQRNGKFIPFPAYYLVDEEISSSKEIILNNVPEGSYTELNFLLGVDSVHNCSGAQSGALDPVNGMFWTWNTGYIFLKLEGHAPLSKSTGQIFEYHIGGYKYPNNCIRKVNLNFGDKCNIGPKSYTTNITVKIDIAEIFKTPTTIDISKLSSVTDFQNSGIIADNYSDMFSILSIK